MSHTGNVTGNYSGNFSGHGLANYSKNDLWSPFGTVNLQQYFDAADYTSVPSDTPATLFDLSGKGNNTTGRTGTPTVEIHPVMGRSLKFDGANAFVHAAGPGNEFGYSFSISLRTATGGGFVIPYAAQRSAQALRIYHSVRTDSVESAQCSFPTNGTYLLGSTALNAVTGLISRYQDVITNNPSVLLGAINGAYFTPANTSSMYAHGITRCGVGFDGNGSWFLTGYVACCGYVKTDALPTIYEMQRMEGYLFWRRNIQSFLDFNHPFRNRPPLIGD